MKKNKFLIVMAAAVCLLLCLTACNREEPHVHTSAQDDGDCTTKVLCIECDDTLVPAKKTHVDSDEDGVCDNCPTELSYLYNEETKTFTVYDAAALLATPESLPLVLIPQ